MKRILLYQDKGVIELYDDDDSNRQEYAERLSTLFTLSKVTIINTSSHSAIVRPSQLTGVVVDEVSLDGLFSEEEQMQMKEVEKLGEEIEEPEEAIEEKQETKEEEEEILTDM
jgi:hypothetical protein